MTNTFAYIILQYCHSILTREAINVGVLFKFSNDNKIYIALKETGFLHLLYREFDQNAFDLALGFISDGISEYNQDLGKTNFKLDQNFTEFIRNKLKWQDSLLQFTDPFISVVINDNQATLDFYTKMLLDN